MNISLDRTLHTVWGNHAESGGIAYAPFKKTIVTGVSTMVERSCQRFPVSLPGALLAYNDGPHVIRSMDLSRNGCRIERTVRLVPGMNIALFLIPSEEDSPILIQDAEVRWSAAEGIGIEFHTVADHHRDRLNLLIHQLKKPH